MKKPPKDIRTALQLLVDRIEQNGEWDEGCFYYNKHSASELQEPLRLAKLALIADKGAT